MQRVVNRVQLFQFLSTPSARRATPIHCSCLRTVRYFYPRPPRGGRQIPSSAPKATDWISIHALREEGDLTTTPEHSRSLNFYPRPPRGGRHERWLCDVLVSISIHALREEGDVTQRTKEAWPTYFYPRPPRGGRQRAKINEDWEDYDFYPRPPRGGRPCVLIIHGVRDGISIHALREEGDSLRWSRSPPSNYFYPRPPRGGRRGISTLLSLPIKISIHALREEGDTLATTLARTYKISIHALREEGDSLIGAAANKLFDFYPRPPRGGRQPNRSSSK